MQLHETTKVEEMEARRCKARLDHLVSIGLPQKDEATKWNDKRMDRILACCVEATITRRPSLLGNVK